ncbi:MAG: hypothetical protein ACT4OG_01560 [Alphaproteobacteria bacterium]
MKWEKFIEEAKADPGRFYRQPADVVRDRRLTNEERLTILNTWERDSRALLVASDENMSGGEPNQLEQVIKARMEVEQAMGRVSPQNGKGDDKADG